MSEPQAEPIDRLIDWLDARVLPVLERIALALERAPLGPANPSRPARGRDHSEVRAAIDAGQWAEAELILREIADEYPTDPRVIALTDELDRSRRFAADDLRQRIEAARQANDPDGAIQSRDELARIVPGDSIREVDQVLVKWLMVLIQRRLRTGTVRPDVVALAGRIAETFGATTEGASLRASLPTLRRAAGLCPRCSEPYAGVGDACPKCLAASSAAAPGSTPFAIADAPEESEESEPEVISEPIDLNNERFWQTP